MTMSRMIKIAESTKTKDRQTQNKKQTNTRPYTVDVDDADIYRY